MTPSRADGRSMAGMSMIWEEPRYRAWFPRTRIRQVLSNAGREADRLDHCHRLILAATADTALLRGAAGARRSPLIITRCLVHPQSVVAIPRASKSAESL